MQTTLSTSTSDEDATEVSAGGGDVSVDDAQQEHGDAESDERVGNSFDPETDVDQLADAEDPDSVAAYMERLLARSRRTDETDQVRWTPPPSTPPAVAEKPEPASTMAATQPESPLASSTDDSAVQSEATTGASPAADIASLSPAHRQDKDQVWATVDSLRELANLSARTAIATHTRQKARGHLRGKTVLTIIAFSLTVLLLTSVYWASHPFAMYGWAAALVCAVTIIELARSFRAVSRTDSPARRSEQEVTSTAVSSGSPVSQADDTTETTITPALETTELTSPTEQAPSDDQNNPANALAVHDLVPTADMVE